MCFLIPNSRHLSDCLLVYLGLLPLNWKIALHYVKALRNLYISNVTHRTSAMDIEDLRFAIVLCVVVGVYT